MRFNIFFTIEGPARTLTDVPNRTNPVESADLAAVLAQLAKHLPNNQQLGLAVIGVRVEPVTGGESDEFDPQTGEKLTGRSAICWECGDGYPLADHILRLELSCPKCREKQR